MLFISLSLSGLRGRGRESAYFLRRASITPAAPKSSSAKPMHGAGGVGVGSGVIHAGVWVGTGVGVITGGGVGVMDGVGVSVALAAGVGVICGVPLGIGETSGVLVGTGVGLYGVGVGVQP